MGPELETGPEAACILQTGLPDEKQREFFEDKWICALQTFNDMNKEMHQYGRDMYGLYSKSA